jgi:sugar (glycoside-pentoside-hexuronide) transporter
MRALTRKEIFGYCVGDLGINLNFQMMGFYLAFFYTDVFGIPPGHVAGLFLAARVWDAVNDPLMGVIADRTQTKRGKFRPYVLFGALPLNLMLVACFFTPDLPMAAKLVYAYVTYILHGMVFTAVGLPYSAISAVMTQDQQERAVISSVRMFFAVVVALSVIILVRPFAEGYFETPQQGYTAAMLAVSVVSTGLLWFSYTQSKERLEVQRETYSLRQLLPIVTKNDALWVLALAMFLNTCVWVTINAVALYYFRYVYQDPNLFERFYFLTLPANVVGVLVTPWLTKRIGKPRTFMIGTSLAALFYGLRYLIPQGNLAMFLAVSCVAGFGMMLCSITQWGMLPDTVEYGHWKTGIRSEGLPFALFSFMQKLGLAVAGALASFVLSVVGYKPNDTQNEAVVAAIDLLFNALPAALSVLCLIALFFYRIDQTLFTKLTADLSARAHQNK